MLPKVAVGRPNSSVVADVENYRLLVGDELMDEVAALAKDLKDVRICHINSTAYGGGVAELLSRYLPHLQRGGLSACLPLAPSATFDFGDLGSRAGRSRVAFLSLCRTSLMPMPW